MSTGEATRRVEDLQPHPLNESIYGDQADANLIASVRARGVLTPLLISPSGIIISGHRRRNAAIAAGLAVVPVVVFGSDDPLDVEEALIESNRQRQKTNEQIGREHKESKRIIAAREGRQGARTDLTSLSADNEVPPRKTPSQKAAAKAGVSLATAERAQAVVERIDKAETDGDTDKAEDLREKLEKSPTVAYNQVRAEQRQAERAATPPLPIAVPLPLTVTIHNADAQTLADLGLNPVHMVITSPPYNVGIDYATHDDSLTPAAYEELVYNVLQQCFQVMVDGARIAVVVPFGVGRNPWVPVAPLIYSLLRDAGFTLRGQIVWDKNSTGNRTSWGSFRLPTDPSLRDTSEVIIVAHKGSGKLAIPDDVRRFDAKGTHVTALADADYFMDLAQDHWVVAPESAQRVGHPAPFPVLLAKRLIDFYAYPGAHVLDPFGGSGTTAIAAIAAHCQVTLVEIDAAYCQLAKARIAR